VRIIQTVGNLFICVDYIKHIDSFFNFFSKNGKLFIHTYLGGLVLEKYKFVTIETVDEIENITEVRKWNVKMQTNVIFMQMKYQ
jgi:hypothetical protein